MTACTRISSFEFLSTCPTVTRYNVQSCSFFPLLAIASRLEAIASRFPSLPPPSPYASMGGCSLASSQALAEGHPPEQAPLGGLAAAKPAARSAPKPLGKGKGRNEG